MPKLLITGGAGYIGSHTAFLMMQKGYEVIIIDNFYHGQKFNHSWAKVIKADFADKKVLNELFKDDQIEAVMHFAGFIQVSESVKNPIKYYENNVIKTLQMLETMLFYNVKKIIFSSSAAIFGNPEFLPITEDHSKNPINPYGETKLIIEKILNDFDDAYNLKFVSLRYFNAAGALPQYELYEQHNPETHLIPILLNCIKNNKPFNIYGIDYETKDGTCIRDYLHVMDIANAHYLALKYLNKNNSSNYFNLGIGLGFSVKEIIEVAQDLFKTRINIINSKPRKGDPAILICDPAKSKDVLKWEPNFSDLEFILKSAYETI